MVHVDDAERGGSVGKVLWHVTMSLDGFIADPDDAMDRVFEYSEPDKTADEVIRTTGSVLAGRRSYDVGRREGEEIYGGAWTGSQFVLTHEAPDDVTDPTIAFLSGDIKGLTLTGTMVREEYQSLALCRSGTALYPDKPSPGS